MIRAVNVFVRLVCALALTPVAANGLFGQNVRKPVEFKVDRPSQQLEMVVNTSRILTMDNQIPRAMVNNTDIVRVVPLSSTQVQLSALRPGVTQVNLWDENGSIYTVDLMILGDSQELEMLLKTEFPQASLRVRPLASSVVLTGRVDRADEVSRIIRMAEDYYPKVINNISVGGVQQVMLHVNVMEVSRTKLRSMGFDWANFGNSDSVVQSVSGLIQSASLGGSVTSSGGETVSFALIEPGNSFFGFLEALQENNLAKVLAEPTLTTISGRPAVFNAGGEFPILVPQSLGTVAVEYKQFGTRVDFVPIVLGNGAIRLEVRPQVSELDNANGVTLSGNRIPGLRTRWVDTAVEMRAGQTLALAGLIQTRVESQKRGFPWLSDLPWAGAAFRRVEEQQNEIELVVTVRPELVDALDPHEVPPCGPGERTTSPDDIELFFRGYLEVPQCCPDGSCSNYKVGPFDGQVIEVPTDATTSATPTTQVKPPNRPREVARQVVPPRPRTNRSVKQPKRDVLTPRTGRYDQKHPRNSTNDEGPADPGLFGRVGYDVLDYKE